MYMNREGVQFSSRDCYDLRSSLGKVNANAVRKFRETIEYRAREGLFYGIPYSVCEFDDAHNVVDWGEAKEKWFDILDKIMYAFEDREPCPSEYYSYVEIDSGSCANDGGVLDQLNLMVDDPDGEKQYEADLEAHYRKVDEGLALFAKHYLDLWF